MTEYKTKQNTVGIPRAMSYFGNYPFYYGFFTALNIEIILSDKTTKSTINEGTKYVVSDTCLPVKVFVGHIINLLEKGCDTIFVPSLQSSAYKINNCSKIRGLPEIIRNVINKPFRMIEPEYNMTEGITFKDFCFNIAHEFEIYDENFINSAIKNGWKVYNDFRKMTEAGLDYKDALRFSIEGTVITKPMEVVRPLSVVIMAHGYNLFDEQISLNLIKKLDKMGVKSYTSLNVKKEDALKSIKQLDEIQYWANEMELTGTAAYYMLNNKVDGIIALSAFGCGPDSLMAEEIQYHAKQRNIPMIHLNIDEHTGEAGFVTRIEAFTDMLMRKKRKTLDDKNIINLLHTSAAKKSVVSDDKKAKETILKI